MKKFFSSLIILTAIAGAIIMSWPSLLGLQRNYFFAQAIASRGFLTAVSVGILLLIVIVAVFAKPLRSFLGSLSLVVILFGGFNAFLALNFGVQNPPNSPLTATNNSVSSKNEQVTVLAWNTMGGEPGAEEIANLAIQQNAEIISLPETTKETTEEIARLMKHAGMPMQVFHRALNQSAAAKSTGLLVSTSLGEYTLDETLGDTSTLPTLVVENSDGRQIVAVHAVAPIAELMEEWKRDLYFLSNLCERSDTIMLGDFNATLDHFTGLGTNGGDLGHCVDVSNQLNASAVGTWPVELPPFLGFSIDRVMATEQWKPEFFRVVEEHDDAGSDHRPIIARLSHVD